LADPSPGTALVVAAAALCFPPLAEKLAGRHDAGGKMGLTGEPKGSG